MSAPQTNIEKQKRRHRGPLIGMGLAVLFGVVLIVYWIGKELTGSEARRPVDAESSQPTTAPNQVILPNSQQGQPVPSPNAAPPSGG